jgi:hypothetical protein
MNMKSLKLLGMVAIGIGLFAVQPLRANDSVQLADFKAKLSQVNLIDLPASASALVSAASDKNQESVTADAVRAAVTMKSTAAPSIVGAVAHTTPSMAARAALTAASMEHRQLAKIVKAAAAGAPSEAGNIVAALVKAYPAKIVEIAVAAGDGAPTSGRDILTAIGNVAPTLQPAIKKVLDGDNSPSGAVQVRAALVQSAMIASQMPQLSRPTAVAPTAGGVSAPFEIIFLPANQVEFAVTQPNGNVVFETTVTDSGFIQQIIDAIVKTDEDVVIIGSPGH